jgi:hypothetical protein
VKVKGNAFGRQRASRWRLRGRAQSPLQQPKPRSPDRIQCHCPSAGCDPRSRMFQRHGRRDKPLRGTTRRIEEFVAALYPLMPSARSACGKTDAADPPYCHFVPEGTLKVYRLSYRRKQKAYERRVEVQGGVLQGKSIQSADSELTAKLLSANRPSRLAKPVPTRIRSATIQPQTMDRCSASRLRVVLGSLAYCPFAP